MYDFKIVLCKDFCVDIVSQWISTVKHFIIQIWLININLVFGAGKFISLLLNNRIIQ